MQLNINMPAYFSALTGATTERFITHTFDASVWRTEVGYSRPPDRHFCGQNAVFAAGCRF